MARRGSKSRIVAFGIGLRRANIAKGLGNKVLEPLQR